MIEVTEIMGLNKYQRDLLAGKEWRWASGATRKRSFGDVNVSKDVPVSQRHGKRCLGRVDITDMPIDLDAKKLMRLPWQCPHCGNMLLHRPEACGRCGTLTPVGEWIRDWGRC